MTENVGWELYGIKQGLEKSNMQTQFPQLPEHPRTSVGDALTACQRKWQGP